ncbi:acetyl-CoA synthetase [Spirochaetia bacterium]|nr:acetyl-CoA synthetase [Spirochaetia bacterium]
MDFLKKYLPRSEFESYEDFYQNYKVSVPENFNFSWDVMDVQAREKPNDRAMLWTDEDGGEAEFTYADIKRLTNQAANVLLAAGIRKGDPVMLILKRRYEYWPVVLALHKIGAIAIPATHLLTVKDIVYRCEAADIVGIVGVDDPELMYRVDEAEVKLKANAKAAGKPKASTPAQAGASAALRYKAFVRSVHAPADSKPAEEAAKLLASRADKAALEAAGSLAPWDDFNVLSAKASDKLDRPPNVNTNEDIMLLYFTSGTTGMPKMVRHNFVYPFGHIITSKYWHQAVPGGLHLTVAETGWAKAAWGKIYGQWLFGTAVFVYDYDRFVPKAMLDIITKYKLTTFCAPPTIYRFFIKEDLSKYDFSSFKMFSVAGEPLNPEIYEQFLAGTGIKLHECYGQTELTVVMATFPWLEPKPGSMGKPSPGYDMDLLKDDGTPCAMGEEGQLVVRTNRTKPLGMFDGYYRDPDLTHTVWHDDIYYTGDVAWRDEDGYYWFVGRSDDVIKSSGYRIGPFEVESALLEHPAVLECAITGAPDPDRGAVVKATVILARGYTASDALKKELQDHVKKTTAPYKYPRIVEFVTELPKTISGKIRRVQIREEDVK